MNTISDQVLERLNAAPPGENKRTGELGQDEFLELMVAQIQNQDPFQPMQNGEFIAQMAQFATVDGISEMRGSMASLNDTMTASQALSASALVGRGVLAPGRELNLDGTGPVGLSVLADANASSVTLDVFDASGALVARKDLAPSGDGVTRYVWDARAADGSMLPAGTYRMQAQATVAGQTLAAETAVARRIDSVTIGAKAGDLRLNLDDGAVMNFNDAREFL